MQRVYVLYQKQPTGYDEANDCPAYETTILAVLEDKHVVKEWLARYPNVFSVRLRLNKLPALCFPGRRTGIDPACGREPQRSVSQLCGVPTTRGS